MSAPRIARGPARIAYAATGWAAAGLGTAGVFVPGLPTTVFVLTAFFCFSRSSPAVAEWLRAHPRLGGSLRPYLAEGGLSPSAKQAALLAMWTSVLTSAAILLPVRPAASFVTLGLGGIGTVAIRWWVPTVAGQAAHVQQTGPR
jgi:uncharacterized membrane protein YbaN (DUF454 family)